MSVASVPFTLSLLSRLATGSPTPTVCYLADFTCSPAFLGVEAVEHRRDKSTCSRARLRERLHDWLPRH